MGIPLLGLAQNHFEGFIYDAKTKEPLPFVHFIYEGNKGFISNQKGTFLFYSTRDPLEINAQAIGYESKKYQIRWENHSSVVKKNTRFGFDRYSCKFLQVDSKPLLF